MVARLTPDQKVASSILVRPKIFFALFVGVVAVFGCHGAFSSLVRCFFLAACARLVSVFWVV